MASLTNKIIADCRSLPMSDLRQLHQEITQLFKSRQKAVRVGMKAAKRVLDSQPQTETQLLSFLETLNKDENHTTRSSLKSHPQRDK
jgi:hypothetical protein